MNYYNIQSIQYGDDYMGSSCNEAVCGVNGCGFWVEYKSLKVTVQDEEQYSSYGAGIDGGFGGRSSATVGYIDIEGVIAAESCCKMEEAQRIVFNSWWLGNTGCTSNYKRLIWDNSCEKEEPIAFTSPHPVINDSDRDTFHTFDTDGQSQQVVLDMGSVKKIGSVYAFFATYTGNNSGVVETSIDGTTWTAYGNIADNYGVDYGAASLVAGARYIRITFPDNGGDTDISEIEIYENCYVLPKSYGQNCVVVQRPEFDGTCGYTKFTVRLRMESPQIESAYETMIECVGETLMPSSCNTPAVEKCCDSVDAVCGCSGGTRISINTCYKGEMDLCIKIKYTGEPFIQNNDGYNVDGYEFPYSWVSKGLVVGANGSYLVFPDNFTLGELDTLTICTKTESIRLNGVELETRPTGDFPKFTGGDNYFILADTTNPFIYGSQICADISFYEVQ